MEQDITAQVDALVRLYVIPIAWKVLGAIAIWIGGHIGIRIIRTALRRTMKSRRFDVTLAKYLDAGATGALRVLVLIAVLGVLGVETTSFAALLAAAGIAIGAAWSGLLSNFAAGLFLLTFRPFRVGDVIAAAGVTGTVRELGLFVTAIDTADNVRTFVGNARLFSDNLQNFSANEYRRAEVQAQLSGGVDAEATIARVRSSLPTIPNVLQSPAPVVEVQSINVNGPVLTAQVFCKNEDYGQVFFDINRTINQAMVRELRALRAS
jgi:small conductance mechanosensitive channel